MSDLFTCVRNPQTPPSQPQPLCYVRSAYEEGERDAKNKRLLAGGAADDALHLLLEGTVTVEKLEVGTVLDDVTVVTAGNVLLLVQLSKAPLARDENLLLAGELVLGPAHGLDGVVQVLLVGPHGQNPLANVDPGDETLGLSESMTHSGLQPISTGARKHLVDPQNVVGVAPHTQVEGILTAVHNHVLVGSNPPGLEGLGRPH